MSEAENLGIDVHFFEIKCTFCLGCNKVFVQKTSNEKFLTVLRCDNYKCKFMEKYCGKTDCTKCNFSNCYGRTIVTSALVKEGSL